MDLAVEGRIDEVMALFKEKSPKKYILNYVAMRKSLRTLYVEALGYQAKFRLKDFILPKNLTSSTSSISSGVILCLHNKVIYK